MKNHLIGGAVLLALIALGGAASAQTNSVSQNTPWQFKDPATTVVQQNSLNLLNQRNHPNQYGTGLSGGSGLLGASASTTNNFFQTYTSTSITSSCQVAAGASLGSCGGNTANGGNNSATATQITRDTTNSSSNTITGNTVTNRPVTDNSTTTNTGSGNTFDAGSNASQ